MWSPTTAPTTTWSAYSYHPRNQHPAPRSSRPSSARRRPGSSARPTRSVTLVASATDPTTTPGNPGHRVPQRWPRHPYRPPKPAIYMYPDPSAPTVYGALELITGSGTTWSVGGRPGHRPPVPDHRAVGHHLRLPGRRRVRHQRADQLHRPAQHHRPSASSRPSWPPRSPTATAAAVRSRAGELFLVKKRGGAIVVTGDIFRPDRDRPPRRAVDRRYLRLGPLRAPPASSTAASTTARGSGTVDRHAQKISQQLDDSFFLPARVLGRWIPTTTGSIVRCIGDKVYRLQQLAIRHHAPTRWWRYYPDSAQGGTDLFYVQEVDGQQIYAAPLSFSTATGSSCTGSTSRPRPSTWQWQGLPSRLTTNRYVEPRTDRGAGLVQQGQRGRRP